MQDSPEVVATTTQPHDSAVSYNCRFPTAFNIYYKSCNGLLTSAIFQLGEHREQPLYAAKFHLRWNGKSNLTLHDGPETTSPILSTVESEKLIGRTSSIKVLSPPAPKAISERMRAEYHLTSESYTFAVETSTEQGSLPERFEWRQSHGEEVRDIAAWSWGWKLVRLTSDAPDGRGGKRDVRGKGVASDGKEVVAVLIDRTTLTRKMAQVQFLGNGATGKLGDAWEIMAVTTALRIWQFRWNLKSTP